MSREKVDYRGHKQNLEEKFGQIALIKFKAAAKYCNIDERSLKKDKTFPLKRIGGRYYVPLENLARWLS